MGFTPNRAFAQEFVRDARTRAALEVAGKAVAAVAERNGKAVDRDYEVTVEQTARGVRLRARGGPLNPASWIELGTGQPGPTPAYAPLRRAARSMGLVLKPSKA